jgi:pimeloyl-ACP methyl ester carboxylesterase
MGAKVALRLKKSTTGRVVPWLAGQALNALGAGFPEVADELAADLFCRPMTGSLPAEPAVRGLESHRFDVVVRGRKLAAWDWGSGPTVLLVHGWSGHAGQMSKFIRPLVESGHYVVAFDQPAHSRSEGKLATLPEMAEAVSAIGHRVGPVKAVIAHSLGATASALALSRDLRAERAVLIAPAAEVPTFLAGFSSRLGLSKARARGLTQAMELRVGSVENYDLRRLAAAVRAAVMVVHDPADREVPFAHGKAIADAANGRLEPAPSLGHRRVLADAEIVRKVVGFVRGEPRAALQIVDGGEAIAG